jgi:hypothetical protein
MAFFESQITSWFGKRVFGKSNSAMGKIIAKQNHVLYFWKVKSRLCLERERMYCAGSGSGYGVPVEKELVIF